MIINLETFLAEAEESSSGLELLLPATSELVAGIFAFAIVFMATEPVTSAHTEKGKIIYGFEIVVSVLQAYIFTLLSAVYIQTSLHPEH